MAVETPSRTDDVVRVRVELGELDPTDLHVQLWVDEPGSAPTVVETTLIDHAGAVARYQGAVAASSDATVVARVLPAARHSNGEAIPGLITWSS